MGGFCDYFGESGYKILKKKVATKYQKESGYKMQKVAKKDVAIKKRNWFQDIKKESGHKI